MIFNQVLEQFGDWTIFWKSLESWFIIRELDLEYFIDFIDSKTQYPPYYSFRKEELESLLEEIGYENVKLTSHLTTKEERIEALKSIEAQLLTPANYEIRYPHLLATLDEYKKIQPRVRYNGEDVLYLIAPSDWLINTFWKKDAILNSKFNRDNAQLWWEIHSIYQSPLTTLAELVRYYGDRRNVNWVIEEFIFDLWNKLPLPKDVGQLEKELKLFSDLTLEKMEEAGVSLTRKEKTAFFLKEELDRLAPYQNHTLYDQKLGNSYILSMFNFVKAEAFTPYPTEGIRKEDPALTFPIKKLIDCEILKQEFFRSIEVKDIPSLDFSAFVYKTIRHDIVEEVEKRLDEFYLSLHYHMIGNWLRTLKDKEHGILAVMTWRFTQFTYLLFLSLFLLFFFFLTRKIFYSGWWKGNVKVVSFVFNLIKEQSSIRAIIHLPLLLTVFLWILINNLLGLFPFGYAITSHILFTFFLGFSLLVGITILIWKEKGKEMIQLFLPKGVPSFLVPFLFVIEVISYIFRTVSLSVRLFANMMAGHALLHILTNFGVVISSLSSPLRFFFIFPLVIVGLITFLELGIALLQAYVFTVLLAIYLNDVYSLESH